MLKGRLSVLSRDGPFLYLADKLALPYSLNMDNQPTLLFLRHGESTSNVTNTFSGMRDNAALTAQGEAQAQAAGESLNAMTIKVDRIISSPLDRAHRTAQIVAQVIGMDPETIRTDIRLAEYDTGSMTGHTRKEITSAELISAPGAEDPDHFRNRVVEAVNEILTQPGTTLIVSHAGVGKMIQAVRQHIEPDEFYDIPQYPNATIIKL